MIKKIVNIVLFSMTSVLLCSNVDLATITNKTSRTIILKKIETSQVTGDCNAGVITDKTLAPGESYDVDISGYMCRIRSVTFAYRGGSGDYTANIQKFPVASSENYKFIDPKGKYYIIDCGNDTFSLVTDHSNLMTCGKIIGIHQSYKSESDAKDSLEKQQESLKDAMEKALK